MHITVPETQLQGSALLSHVQETTTSPHRCHTWFDSMNHDGARHLKVCAKDMRMHLVGSEKG